MIVVMPVYEDADACGQLLRAIADRFGIGVYVVAVDDGSVRQPLSLADLETAGVRGAVLRLRRNVGHQKAIAIGLGYVVDRLKPSQPIVIMDSDGEDMPTSIPELVKALESEDVDVVVARRRSRVESLQFKTFYVFYRAIFRLLTGRPISFGNFMALKPAAVRRLAAMQELSIHVASAVLASKLRTAICPIRRGPRYSGRSKMNFVGLALHGFRALMVFAEDVLVRVGMACALIAMLSIAGVVIAVGLKLAGFSTPGWFSVALGILVLMLLQTGALSLMTLMLTGVVRGGTVTSSLAYHDFIEQVFETPTPKLPHPYVAPR